MWTGLLHHVCNKHEWIGGKCNHADGEHDKPYPGLTDATNTSLNYKKSSSIKNFWTASSTTLALGKYSIDVPTLKNLAFIWKHFFIP